MSTEFTSLFPSTDAEFVRWVLWHYGIPYQEHPHAPLFECVAGGLASHGALSLKEWFSDNSNAIVNYNGKILEPRDVIAAYFEAQAAPDKKLVPAGMESRVAVWWKEYAFDWGWSVARWVYYYLLQHKELILPSLDGKTPWYERAFTSAAYPLVAMFLRKDLKLSPELAAQDLANMQQWFDKTDPIFAGGQQFLVGNKMTLADVIFTGYGAPIVFPKGYGAPLPDVSILPAEIRGTVEGFRARPTGQYLLRMYAIKAARPGSPA